MKKITIFALCLALAASLCACGCSNNMPETTPSATSGTNGNDKMPTETMTVPVPETNIPDPSVNNYTGDMTEGTNGVTGRSNFPMTGVK